MRQYECICFVVHHGLAGRILKAAFNHGVIRGTVFYGSGTIKSFWLDFFELNKSEKEIIFMTVERQAGFRLMEEMNEKLKLHKHNHGIVYSIPLTNHMEEDSDDLKKETEKEREAEQMYTALTIIVNKGEAETALEVAQKAGARGGTIINARGAGAKETSRVFNIDIEQEKEILLILARKGICEDIAKAIDDSVKSGKLGEGIVYLQNISKVYGIYDDAPQ